MAKNGFDELVAIQLSIRFWPGHVKLRPEDLGLEIDKVPEEVFYLGNKKLYPQEWRHRFNHLAGKARSCLNDRSYPFVLEYVRTIPKRNLAKMVEQLEELKAEFMAAADEFIIHYEVIKDDWAAKYPDFWEKLVPYYPTRNQLQRKFDFFWNVFEIKGAEVQEGSAPEIIAAYEQARTELQERYEEMVEEAIVYLRKKVLEVVTNLSSRLKEGRLVRNDTLESVRRVEAWFTDLNIFGDRDVENSLTKLRAVLNGTDYEQLKDNEPLKKELAGLADQVAAAAGKLDDVGKVTGRYKRQIDLS